MASPSHEYQAMRTRRGYKFPECSRKLVTRPHLDDVFRGQSVLALGSDVCRGGVVLATPVEIASPPRDTPSLPAFRVIKNTDPSIFYHGRWDNFTGSWWAGTGFKVNFENLNSLAITLGANSSWPSAPTAFSFDNGPWTTYQLVPGVNHIEVPPNKNALTKKTLLRVNVQGWQENRIQFQSLNVNVNAKPVPYKPAKKIFQFIGDSLSAGQFLPFGINQAWPFLVAEHFKAEQRINAQPGATLTDMESYGNVHGISYQYFRTEDTGFIWQSDHNYTTPWHFGKEEPKSTHIVIHIGANDASHQVSADDFVKVYSDFLVKLRKIYPRQPIFILTPWGWPNPDGNTYYYYDGQYQRIVSSRRDQLGDRNIHLVDTTGWVAWSDLYPDNSHPNVEGMANIASKFIKWFENWESNL